MSDQLLTVTFSLGANAVLSTLLGVALLYLYRAGRRTPVAWWGGAWAIEGLRLALGGASLVLRMQGEGGPMLRLGLSAIVAATGVLQALLLLEGARAWVAPRPPTWRRFAALAAASGALGLALVLAVPEGPAWQTARLFVRLEVPRLLQAAAFGWGAWQVATVGASATIGHRRALAILLAFAGLLKVQYAFATQFIVASSLGTVYSVGTTVLEIAALTAIGMAVFYLASAELRAEADASGQARALALAQSEALYRTVLAGAHDIVILMDPQGTIRYVTPSVERIAGWAPAELVGRSPADVLDPTSAEAFRARFVALAAGEMEAVDPVEVQARAKDGRWLTLEAAMRREIGPDGTPVIVSTSRDLQERKRLEAQLLRAQRLESLGRLAGGVAHDFNNLLGVIFASADLAQDALPRDHDAALEVREIRLAAERAAALTRQLLAFSRRQVIEPRRLVPGALAASLQPMLRRLLDASVTLDLDVDRSQWAVRADPAQVEQVLLNFVVNARDATPDGGRITLAVDDVSFGIGDLAGNPERHVGDHVRLRVRDTGSGMDEATMSRIFEPFFSTKEPGKGTGLGLAMVYGAVQQAGGWVEVQSAPGRGSTFDVYLPRDTAAEDATVLAAPPPLPVGGATATILVVDDQPQVRALAARALRQRGYEVLEAATGREGLAVADAATELDLVVTDIVMPELSGPAMVKTLKAARPEVRVLYTSGYAKSAFAEDALSQDGAEFIGKPYGVADLVARVQRLLAAPAPTASVGAS
ncbi:MAG: ATP-binding protein [Gemmatimonadaceae bacterium]|nr:ATP-binding protein [Gemmatimonadaceae bacterium]